MFDTVWEYSKDYGPVLMMGIGCASMVAAALAPLTKTDKDDKLAAGLKWLHDKLSFLGLHKPSVGAAVHKMTVADPSRDHRTK